MGVRRGLGHAGCISSAALAALIAAGGILLSREGGGETGVSAPLRAAPDAGRADCSNQANPDPTLAYDAVHVLRTPGITVGPVLDRSVVDATVATRLAHEVAAWRQLFSADGCRSGSLGTWYALALVARGRLNSWQVVVPAESCDTPSAPPLCADLASVLHIGRSSGHATVVHASSVRVVRTPGLLVLPRVDRLLADRVTATRLEDDILRLRPRAISVPGGPAPVELCAADYGTSYALTFSAPGAPSWTATVGIEGCSSVTVPGWPVLVGDATLVADLGAALGLTEDETAPVPCVGTARPGHVCYQQPPVHAPS